MRFSFIVFAFSLAGSTVASKSAVNFPTQQDYCDEVKKSFQNGTLGPGFGPYKIWGPWVSEQDMLIGTRSFLSKDCTTRQVPDHMLHFMADKAHPMKKGFESLMWRRPTVPEYANIYDTCCMLTFQDKWCMGKILESYTTTREGECLPASNVERTRAYCLGQICPDGWEDLGTHPAPYSNWHKSSEDLSKDTADKPEADI